MSGDVQPRKRKDKNKKKKEDDVINTSRNEIKEPKEVNPLGVHAGAMGPEDVHLHVHKDHGVGGNWCVKVVFFSLLAILLGIAGLILLENRGVTDVDTPVTESRFSEYFEGWVEEKQDAHDEHEHLVETLNNDHNHDHGGQDDADEDDERAQHNLEEDHEEDEEHNAAEQSNEIQSGDKNDETDSAEDEGIEADARKENASDEEEGNSQGSGNDEDGIDNEAENQSPELIRSKRSTIFAEAFPHENVDDDDDIINPFNDDEINQSEEDTTDHKREQNQLTDDNEDDSNDNTIIDNTLVDEEKDDDSNENFSDDISPFEEHVVNDENIDSNSNNNSTSNNPIEKKPEEEDDEEDGSFEDDKFFENDSGEDLHLEKLSKQEEKIEEPETPQATSLAVKLIVGLALVGVAAQVFARRSTTHDDNDDGGGGYTKFDKKMAKEKSYDELSMKRRLTIADDEVEYEDECDDYEDEYDGDEGDEVEYEDDEEYDEQIASQTKLKTFEQFDSAFKTKPGEQVSIIKQMELPKSPEIVSKRFESPVFANQPTKSELAKKENSSVGLPNLEPKSDVKNSMASVTVNSPKDPSSAPIKQMFTIQQKQPSPTPPPKQPSPILPKQPSPIPSKDPSSSIPSQPLETFTANISKLIPGDNTQKYDPHDDEDDAEYADEEEEEYSGDEEDEEEEEISDVDDSDLLKRLEEKYGKLPNKPLVATEEADDDEHEDYEDDDDEVEADEEDKSWTKLPSRGPQSIGTDGLESEINEASRLVDTNPKAALNKIDGLIKKYRSTPELLYWRAVSLDRLAAIYHSNQLLDEAIDNYETILNHDGPLNDTFFKLVGEKCIERIRFRWVIEKAIPVHEKLITRFEDEPKYQNQLAVSYLLLDRLSEAKAILHKVLLEWQTNGFALVHYGFVLKLHDNNYEQAAIYLKKGIDTGEEGTNDGRFYYHLGDALTKLQRIDDAREIYKQGAAHKIFLSEYQRSLYNVDRLKSHPYWTKQETTYDTQFDTLERNWNIIRQEGLSVLNEKGYFTNESEDLRDTGIWKQFNLFVSGRRIEKNCQKTPITCKLIEQFQAARQCARGQIKFSVMHPKTHVWPHCGPTNCRIRAHLGLKVPADTFIRVGDEIRSWEEGQFLLFDDSFEHEVWHNGTSLRLVLIVDVWHPDLTLEERNTLTPI